MAARAARMRSTARANSNCGVAALPVESSIDTPAMPVSTASRTWRATPSGSSAKPFSKSALIGSPVAATMWRRCSSTCASGMPPSGKPPAQAAPELVVASALKPRFAR